MGHDPTRLKYLRLAGESIGDMAHIEIVDD